MKVKDLVKIIKNEYIYVYCRGLRLQVDDTNILFDNPGLAEKEINFIMAEDNPRAIAIYVYE